MCSSDLATLISNGRLTMALDEIASRGATASFGLWPINRGVARPWKKAEHLGDLVSTLESAWRALYSLELDRDHPIE